MQPRPNPTPPPPGRFLRLNSGCLKLHCSYSNSFNMSNVGDFFQKLNSLGPRHSSEKERESRCLVSDDLRKTIKIIGSFAP